MFADVWASLSADDCRCPLGLVKKQDDGLAYEQQRPKDGFSQQQETAQQNCCEVRRPAELVPWRALGACDEPQRLMPSLG